MRQGNCLQGSREGRQTSEATGVVREDKVVSRERARGRMVVAWDGELLFWRLDLVDNKGAMAEWDGEREGLKMCTWEL